MNTQTQEALKMAIDALEEYPYKHRTAKMDDALQACKEALEQPQPGNQKLRDALERYGKHDSRCGENVACIRRCDCGLEQVLKENT